MSGQEQVKGAGDKGFEVLAVDDGGEKAVLEQEFRALESFGEFLANGLLDDARTSKSNERAGLANIEVAEDGETGGNATSGGIGEHGNVGQFFVVEAREGRGNFGELHEADGAFHHARAARAGNGDEGLAGFDGEFDAASNFFTDDCAHGAAHEAKLHGTKDHGAAAALALFWCYRVIHAQSFLC